jgi:ribosomal protein L11 methyltransferase
VRWLEVSVLTSREAAEAVGAVLLELRSGYAEEETPRGIVLRAYLWDGEAASSQIEAIRRRIRALPAFGLDPGPAEVTVRAVEDEDWAEAWKAHFHSFRVGPFRIRPPWEPIESAEDDVEIVLNPGMAFGTGLHESTRLCLHALSDYVRGGETVLDIGTGSGILAIAAAKLGAGRVIAVDNDPLSCAVAGENVRHNGVQVEVRCADLFEGNSERADVIVMNITAPVVARALGPARAHLRPAGVLIASGFVDTDVPELLAQAQDVGFLCDRLLAQAEWRALVFVAP